MQMRVNILSYMLNSLAGKISRLTLKIFSAIDFFFHHSVFKNRNEIHSKSKVQNFVVFRLDDIPYDMPVRDEGRIAVDLAIMDVFNRKKQNVTLGLLMRYVELHPKLLKIVLEGHRAGYFELALHGWDHDDYSKLNKKDQESLLLKANIKFYDLFGISSKIFIPPYNRFNRNTLHVMKKLGLNILSSSLYSDYHLVFMPYRTKKTDTPHIYHLPEMVSFEKFNTAKPVRNPTTQILGDVEKSISKYGYAIVTMHPQGFIKFSQTKSTDLSLNESILDSEQIKKLDSFIQMILDTNIRITSFSKLVGLN